MRDYGKGKPTQPSKGYGKGVKEGPTKAHSKPTQHFRGGGKPAAKSAARDWSGNQPGRYDRPNDAGTLDTSGMVDGVNEVDPKWGGTPPSLQYNKVGGTSMFNPDGSPILGNPSTSVVTAGRQIFNGPLPTPNPKRYAGIGGPLGPPVPGYPTAAAHTKVTAPGGVMGSGYNYNMTDASGMGSVRDDYGYGANAGHGYGTHDYGVGAQMTGFTGADNFGFTDFNQNLSSAPENNSSGGGSGGGSSGGGMGGGGGGFGGADQESKG